MMAQMGKGGETGEDTTMKASDLMDTTDGFYTYAGSLTTPTCNAVVTWVVLASVLPIKESTMSQFMALTKGTDKVSKNGNFRPLQAKGDRVIYRTAEVISPACHTAGAREAEFTCGAKVDGTKVDGTKVDDDKSEEILTISKAALAMATIAAVAALAVAAMVFTMRSTSSPPPLVVTPPYYGASPKPQMVSALPALQMAPNVGAGLVMPGQQMAYMPRPQQ